MCLFARIILCRLLHINATLLEVLFEDERCLKWKLAGESKCVAWLCSSTNLNSIRFISYYFTLKQWTESFLFEEIQVSHQQHHFLSSSSLPRINAHAILCLTMDVLSQKTGIPQMPFSFAYHSPLTLVTFPCRSIKYSFNGEMFGKKIAKQILLLNGSFCPHMLSPKPLPENAIFYYIRLLFRVLIFRIKWYFFYYSIHKCILQP